MPNWCSNNVTITLKDGVDVDDFISKIGHFETHNDSQFVIDFEKIVPQPFIDEDGEITEEGMVDVEVYPVDHPLSSYKSPYWYKWRLSNWGTKWNVYPTPDWSCDHYDKSKQEIQFGIQTAWSPPEGIYERLCKMDEVSDFSADYEEEGMDFYGVYQLEDGELVDIEMDRVTYWIDHQGLSDEEFKEQFHSELWEIENEDDPDDCDYFDELVERWEEDKKQIETIRKLKEVA